MLSRTRQTVSRPIVCSEFLFILFFFYFVYDISNNYHFWNVYVYYLIFVQIFLCKFFFIIHFTYKLTSNLQEKN